jgi:hypothetical protein
VGKPEKKRPLETPRHGGVDNIKINFREIGWAGMDWNDWLKIRDQSGSCEHGNEPSCYINCWQFLE